MAALGLRPASPQFLCGGGWLEEAWRPLTLPLTLGTGEEWLVRSVGAYLPAVFEEVLDLVDAVILTEKVCAPGMWVKGPWVGNAPSGENSGGQCESKREAVFLRSLKKLEVISPEECPGLEHPRRVEHPPGLAVREYAVASSVRRSPLESGGRKSEGDLLIPVSPADSPAPPCSPELPGLSGCGPPHWRGMARDSAGHSSTCARCL